MGRADTRDWLRQINEVLRKKWNPIRGGVPDDEYQSYVGPIATMLLNGTRDSELAAYLNHVETEVMGLGGSLPLDRFTTVIAALRALDMPSA
jgi:hypothetical protein